MDTLVLNATTRTVVGKQVKQLRREGLLPGVVYGHDLANTLITLNSLDYQKVFKKIGTSSLVDLVIDGKKPVKVLLHEPDFHPTRPLVFHADFYAVRMNEKLETEIPLSFVGEADAVSTLDGTLTILIDEVTVECFPDKLVPQIEVDITALKTFDDVIRISDIIAPDGIEILNEAEETVATVTQPISDEELAALDEAPVSDADAMANVEVTSDKKTEDEEKE